MHKGAYRKYPNISKMRRSAASMQDISVGFQAMPLKPYVLPNLVDLNLDE